MARNVRSWAADDLTDWASGNEVYIPDAFIDIRDIKLKLPESVIRCYACGGNGKYVQRYCDAPRLTGPCDSCKSSGFMYSETAKPVPFSVTNQIAGANRLEVRQAWGLDWSHPTLRGGE